MKKLCLLVLCALPLALYAQDDSYTMIEMVTMQPNGEENEKLAAAMKSHNEKFHKEGTFQAWAMAVNTGPQAGRMVWSMGPLKWSDVDNRPSGNAHDADWKNVSKHIVKGSLPMVEYWRRNDDLSVVRDGGASMVYVTFVTLSDEYGFLFNNMMKMAKEAIEEEGAEESFAVWVNEFRQGSHGRHMALVGDMKSWGDMDKPSKFRENYIKVHGEGEWINFLRTWELAIEDSYDEIWSEI